MSIWVIVAIAVVWVTLSVVILMSICIASSRSNRGTELDELPIVQHNPQREVPTQPVVKPSLR